MAKPLICTENFNNLQQFPQHARTDSADDAGTLYQTGTNRRGRLAVYTLTDPAAKLDLRINCDRVRGANFLAIDRNSDIVGRLVQLLGTNGPSDFSGDVETIIETTPTDSVVYGSGLAAGAQTEDGAYVWRFESRAYLRWQLAVAGDVVPAPKLGGVYLGLAHEPTYPRMSFDDEPAYNVRGEVRRGVPDADVRFGRTYQWNQLLRDEAEWAEVRKLRQHLKRGYPAWLVPDQDKAERAGMFYASDFAAPFAESPVGRTVSLSLEEYDPVKL